MATTTAAAAQRLLLLRRRLSSSSVAGYRYRTYAQRGGGGGGIGQQLLLQQQRLSPTPFSSSSSSSSRRRPLSSLSSSSSVSAAAAATATASSSRSSDRHRGAAAAAAASLMLLLALGAGSGHAASSSPPAAAAAAAERAENGGEQAQFLERIDARLHRAYPEFMQEHLIHQTLSGEEKIEDLRLYRDKRDGSIVVYTRLGRLLSGHPGVVHGGTLAALLDNSFGVAFFGAKVGNGFTANLTVNYRRPVTVGTEVKVLARVEKIEGRKVFLTGQIRDARDDSILYTEATCLFVTSTSGLLRRQSKLNMG